MQPTHQHNEPTNERTTKNMIHAVKRQGAATEHDRHRDRLAVRQGRPSAIVTSPNVAAVGE